MGEQERVPTLVVVLSVVLSGLLGMQYTGTVHKDSSSLSNAFCSSVSKLDACICDCLVLHNQIRCMGEFPAEFLSKLVSRSES
jgi:hypothetical protein